MKFLPSSSSSPPRLGLAAIAAAALVTASTVGPAQADSGGHQVVAEGLNNPRHLTVAATGDIFVAEAGTGGKGPCFPSPEDPTAEVCFGSTGSITRISGTRQHRVVSGLPSIAEESGGGASGPSGVIATGGNKLTIMIGLGANPELRDQNAELAAMGTIVESHWRNGNARTLADIAAHERETNPIYDPDSNPVSILRQGSSYVVADAGGNTVVRASKQGATSTIAVLPGLTATAPPFLGLPPGTQIPVQAVPTSVAVGPDGAYYVSQLTGFPFEKGLAKIYRIGGDGSLSVYAQGLTNVTDLAFADDGTLYAVQISADGLLTGPIGALVKVNPGGTPEVVAGGLLAPYGLALSGDSAYVTTGSVLAGGGQVVRIPVP
jgi:hypothetical protein